MRTRALIALVVLLAVIAAHPFVASAASFTFTIEGDTGKVKPTVIPIAMDWPSKGYIVVYDGVNHYLVSTSDGITPIKAYMMPELSMYSWPLVYDGLASTGSALINKYSVYIAPYSYKIGLPIDAKVVPLYTYVSSKHGRWDEDGMGHGGMKYRISTEVLLLNLSDWSVTSKIKLVSKEGGSREGLIFIPYYTVSSEGKVYVVGVVAEAKFKHRHGTLTLKKMEPKGVLIGSTDSGFDVVEVEPLHILAFPMKGGVAVVAFTAESILLIKYGDTVSAYEVRYDDVAPWKPTLIFLTVERSGAILNLIHGDTAIPLFVSYSDGTLKVTSYGAYPYQFALPMGDEVYAFSGLHGNPFTAGGYLVLKKEKPGTITLVSTKPTQVDVEDVDEFFDVEVSESDGSVELSISSLQETGVPYTIEWDAKTVTADVVASNGALKVTFSDEVEIDGQLVKELLIQPADGVREVTVSGKTIATVYAGRGAIVFAPGVASFTETEEGLYVTLQEPAVIAVMPIKVEAIIKNDTMICAPGACYPDKDGLIVFDPIQVFIDYVDTVVVKGRLGGVASPVMPWYLPLLAVSGLVIALLARRK